MIKTKECFKFEDLVTLRSLSLCSVNDKDTLRVVYDRLKKIHSQKGVRDCLKKLEISGFIRIERVGRTCYYYLTERGLEFKILLEKTRNLLR